jgi:hypothetical protein
MAHRMRGQWLLVWIVGLFGFLAAAAAAQQATPITFNLRSEKSVADWPVAVTSVAIGGKPVSFDHPVAVSGRWLRSTVITLRNVSPKTIVQVGMGVVFPESGTGKRDDPIEAVWSSLGLVPKVVYTDRGGHYYGLPSPGVQPLRIPPGGSVRLLFTRDGDEIQAKLARKGMPITKATIQFTTIYFADATRWSAGQYFLAPHPAGGAWTRVTKEQFFSGTTGGH